MLATRASLPFSIYGDGKPFDSSRSLPKFLTNKPSSNSISFSPRSVCGARSFALYAATSQSESETVQASEEGNPKAEAKAEAKVEEAKADEEEKYEEYEVELEKPIGLQFYKGVDGGVYIKAIAPGGNADKTKKFTVGDKVLATSAVFGNEIWPAAAYGQTMYAIRQRIGTLYMRVQKRYGKIEDTVMDEKAIIAAERNSGVISDRVRQIQMQNAMRKMELKKKREMELKEGLKLYKDGRYEDALEMFESVLGSKPELNEVAVTSYNVACCYSRLNQVEAGLSALEDAMKAGFENYKKIRNDPDLANLRASEKFKPLLDKYDEPFINENAINALKSLFGFNKK
eukprot:TRINITY_DN37933_c0_g1_i1.p1 TRINITY_DN37933_c0_g1~~TRINITY_DN37933_c0_g1_i1.p1  ORF type:complete len:343 (+),score=73.08 TRINITY_DN37933_c0_g1_i1:146-1174(+)